MLYRYGVDYVFHATLKQVQSCKFFPIEVVKTNVIGTENVLNAAIEAGVKKVICLSTDKVVYLVNAINKLAERYDMPILYSCHTRFAKKNRIV